MRIRPANLLLPFLLVCSFAGHAQIRIFAGPQMTNVYYNVAGEDQPTEAKYGFVGGLGLTYFIESSLYFTPSLYYSRRGYKVTYTQRADPPDLAALNNNTTINTICFSPQLQWNFSQGSKYVFVRLGPTLDVAINGHEEFDSSGGKHVERDMLFSSVGYSLITSSANFQVGFEQKKGLGLFVFYEHGLSGLNNKDHGPYIVNRIAGLALGWKF